MRVPVLALAILGGLASFCMVSSRPLSAQAAPQRIARIGDRVRLHTRDGQVLDGTLQYASRDSIVLETGVDRLSSVAGLDIASLEGPPSRSRTQGILAGARIGLLTGAAAGAVLGAFIGIRAAAECDSSREPCANAPVLAAAVGAAVSAVVVGAVGGVAGLVVGGVTTALSPRYKWIPIRADTVLERATKVRP